MTHKISRLEQLNMGAAMQASDELRMLRCGFNITHGYVALNHGKESSAEGRYLIRCMHDEATAELCAAYVEGCRVCPLGFITIEQLVEIIKPLSK